MKHIIMGVMCSFLIFCSTVANPHIQDKIPVQSLPLATGSEVFTVSPHRPAATGFKNSLSTDDYVGEIDTVGTTWYPLQHNGSCGRMIRLDSEGNINVVWTNALEAGLAWRHIYYNVMTSTGWASGEQGTPIENATRASYVTLAMNSEGYAFPCFHVIVTGTVAHAAVAANFFTGYPFMYWELPYVDTLEVIWPTIAVDIQDRLHIVSTENPASGIPATPMRMYYCRGTFDPLYFEIEYQPNQTLIGWTETIAADIAASRHSDRMAIVYTAIRTTLQGDTNQYNNDIYLVVSEDGITWDFSHPINVTNFIYPDTSLFPDTLAAMGDTLRAYTDASVFFDQNDHIHVAFTTPYYDEIRGYISQNNSLIWHWSEETGYFSLVANGWFGAVPYTCGAWQRFVERPCLCEDENSGDLYITYQLFDTSDVAANGIFQSEVMISRSTTGGMYWSTGIDVTNTHAPGAGPNYCLSEYSITCNETIVDDHVHLLHLIDTDGWQYTNPYGEYTLDYVIYQKVPINEIPSTPLMPVRPMHVDSTGMPPPSAIGFADRTTIPSNFKLHQNYPNPFNAVTNIRFDVPYSSRLRLSIYNVLGELVTTLMDKNMNAGTHTILFDASRLSSGIYFYELVGNNCREVKKAILLK